MVNLSSRGAVEYGSQDSQARMSDKVEACLRFHDLNEHKAHGSHRFLCHADIAERYFTKELRATSREGVITIKNFSFTIGVYSIERCLPKTFEPTSWPVFVAYHLLLAYCL